MNGGISGTFEQIRRTGDTVASRFDSIRSNIESAIGAYVGNFGTDLRNGRMMGVNYAGLAEVNAAIETWLETIETDLNNLKAEDPTIAFRGEQFTTAIQDFIESVRTTCYNMASQLREFQKIMNDAIAAYKARDTQLKSDITSSAETVKSQASEYGKVSHQG